MREALPSSLEILAKLESEPDQGENAEEDRQLEGQSAQ
ncbi:hypothetical protein QE369_001243 [Agrobacterium larrymoorei]|uniref:Uncharacterized protein n=1 Tax=Agrobacterium larrymoorei TaxID=160699 RepID=A0AAJ2EQC5_9HYPH|nr:hypothetical protein [Agrobacterium larrymoorei]